MEKIVKDGLRDCTLILDGSECAVKFDTCFRAFAVRNDGAADVFISKTSGIVPDADGVMCIKSGGSAVFAHMDIYADTVYLLGNGKVQVHAQNDTNNPFNSAPAISDGGVTAEGNPVTLDGLQGGVPFAEIVVSGKNLIPYPYYDGNSKTHNGITFTVNADGTITANGTATASAIFYISTNYTIKKGIYTLSGCPKSDSNTDYVLQFATGDWSFKISDFGNGATTQIDNDINLQIFRIAISSGVVCDNLVFRPQLELGSTPTAYEPPITGRELTVNVCGKNLISENMVKKSGTVTDNSDSWIIEWTAAMYVRFDKIFLKPNTDYTISWWQKADNGSDCVRIGIINGDDESAIIEQNSAEIKTGTEYTLCSFTFNSGNNRNIYVQFLRGSITGTVYVEKSIQLEIGSTATPYEPYHGSTTTITPDSNPYTIQNDIRQVDGLNNISVSAGELSVTGVRKNSAIKRIWDKLDELTTAIIVSNGESE